MTYDKMMMNIPLKNELWKQIESMIDERVFTDLSMYKGNLDNEKEIQDIVDAITDLAWKIENDMKDSL